MARRIKSVITIDLTTATNNEPIDVDAKQVLVTKISDSASFRVKMGSSSEPEFTAQGIGPIVSCDEVIDKLFLSWDAQPGKEVELLISDENLVIDLKAPSRAPAWETIADLGIFTAKFRDMVSGTDFTTGGTVAADIHAANQLMAVKIGPGAGAAGNGELYLPNTPQNIVNALAPGGKTRNRTNNYALRFDAMAHVDAAGAAGDQFDVIGWYYNGNGFPTFGFATRRQSGANWLAAVTNATGLGGTWPQASILLVDLGIPFVNHDWLAFEGGYKDGAGYGEWWINGSRVHSIAALPSFPDNVTAFTRFGAFSSKGNLADTHQLYVSQLTLKQRRNVS